MTTAEMTKTTQPNGETKRELTPASRFRIQAANIASSLLTEWVGADRAKEATGRISGALAASAASARDPNDFYECTPQSIGMCVAIAALTGIMPGVGSTALAYVVPQRPRKDEDPQLQYSLSHRGLNALARRCGQTMVAIPIGMSDRIESTEDGEVEVTYRDIDNPPTTFEDLRGIVVIVKEISSGVVVSWGWVPRTLIEKRRSMSRSFSGRYPQYSPWTTWPIEMSMKTAMHYTISRGWCVIDDTDATRALNADVASDTQLLPAPSAAPAIEDARSASDRIADRLESPQQDNGAEETSGNGEHPSSDSAPQESEGEAASAEQETEAKAQASEGNESEFAMQDGETFDAYRKRIEKSAKSAKETGAIEAIGQGVIDAEMAGKLEPDQFIALNDMIAARRVDIMAAAEDAKKKAQKQGSLIE